MPIFPDAGLVGSIKGQAGIINAFGSSGLNPVEAFNYGNTFVRGFQPGNMGPRIGTQPVGYTQYAGASLEATFPLPLLPETSGLSGAIWAEAGEVGGQGASGAVDPPSINPPLKSAEGGSLVWDSPFGPLSGDLANVLSKATDDKTQMYSLTLQTML